jgi:PAS domain S-box-containing protein
MKMMETGPSVCALIIDRHGGTGAAVSEILAGVEELRFETTLVSSYDEALQRLAASTPQILIVCPDPSAGNAGDEVQALGLDLPLLLVTPEVDRKSRIAATRSGIQYSFSLDECRSSLFAIAVLHIIEHRRSVGGRKRLETLLECSPSHILTIDGRGIIQFINHTLPPYSREQVVGQSWLGFVPEAKRAESEAMLRTVLMTGASHMYETVTAGLDGGQLLFSCHIGPVRERNEIVGAVVIAQDVTERRRVAADLLAAQRMAAVGTLAAGIAHEINTPIQFVSDSLVFLREASVEMFAVHEKLAVLHRAVIEGLPTDDAAAACTRSSEEADVDYVRENVPAAFERCVDGLNRVATIVRSLKEFAHPSNREMSPVDLNRAIESTLTIARSEYKYVAELETEFGDLPPVTCHVDEINQVILNLIVNAAHAIQDVVRGSEQKGRIFLRTTIVDDDVLIAVSDTGTGIPSDIVPRIFDPFFTTKEVGRGTGQGLAIARTIVREHHGGDIAVDTHIGKGTTFSIRLPIKNSLVLQGMAS